MNQMVNRGIETRGRLLMTTGYPNRDYSFFKESTHTRNSYIAQTSNLKPIPVTYIARSKNGKAIEVSDLAIPLRTGNSHSGEKYFLSGKVLDSYQIQRLNNSAFVFNYVRDEIYLNRKLHLDILAFEDEIFQSMLKEHSLTKNDVSDALRYLLQKGFSIIKKLKED
jgi:hypothetical protein